MPRVTLKSRLPTITASLRPRVSAAVKEAAQVIAEDAEARVNLGPAPVHLRERISVVRHEAAGYLVVAGDDEAYYGHILEFGSSKMPAHPFLIPALEAHRETAESLVGGSLRAL